MAPVRLEKLEHPLVGGPGLALERVGDDVRQVIVADRARLGRAQARMAAERLGDERMERAKPGVVILFAAKLRCTRRGPAGSGSPPLDFDLAVFLHEVDGGGTLRRESRPPDFAIAHTQ